MDVSAGALLTSTAGKSELCDRDWQKELAAKESRSVLTNVLVSSERSLFTGWPETGLWEASAEVSRQILQQT